MIEKRILTDGSSITALKPVDDFFIDSVHQVNLSVCSDPLCNCGGATMIVTTERNAAEQIEYKVPINVLDECLNIAQNRPFYTKESQNQSVKEVFEEGLTKKDWQFLRTWYFDKKFAQTNQVDTKKVEYRFSLEDLRDSSNMFVYNDAFPCSHFTMHVGEEHYLVMDNYCKNPSCKCTGIVLEVVLIDEERKEGEIVGIYQYDYQTKKGTIRVVNKSEKGKAAIKEVIDGLFEKYTDILQILRKRNKIVRELYAKASLAYTQAKILLSQSKNVVGRNAPCPCGSGKKYKRCCMKKVDFSF